VSDTTADISSFPGPNGQGGIPVSDNPVIDSARKAVGLDREAIHAEIVGLLQSGMPDAVVIGFMQAKVEGLAGQYEEEAQWSEARRIVDEIGVQAHGGDPVKKARVDHFNDMFIAELRKRQGESR